MIIAYTTSDFIDVASLVARVRRRDCGAVVVFEGNVRSPSGGAEIKHLEYESYERVADQQMEQIATEVGLQHGLTEVLVVHRIGTVTAGDTAFLVAVSAPHRTAAFAGSALIVDRIKAEVAIWKQEILE